MVCHLRFVIFFLLKVGTLDTLVRLSHDLEKLDVYTDRLFNLLMKLTKYLDFTISSICGCFKSSITRVSASHSLVDSLRVSTDMACNVL